MAAKTEFTIDAEGKSLGRVASQAAKTLMGKTSPDYVPNIRSDVKVLIVNAGKLSMPEKKRGYAMAASSPIIAITTRSSINVKPLFLNIRCWERPNIGC